MSIPYIIISSNSEDEGTDSSTTVLETEYDPEDFSYEDSSEENPSANKEDEPLSAQFTPTPPTQAAPTEDVEILQDVLVLARIWISNSESRLDESGDREAAIERRIRAIEEHFGPDGSS
ncbi:hypothetical protein Tco_0222851 [Tanacetum coccineum]